MCEGADQIRRCLESFFTYTSSKGIPLFCFIFFLILMRIHWRRYTASCLAFNHNSSTVQDNNIHAKRSYYLPDVIKEILFLCTYNTSVKDYEIYTFCGLLKYQISKDVMCFLLRSRLRCSSNFLRARTLPYSFLFLKLNVIECSYTINHHHDLWGNQEKVNMRCRRLLSQVEHSIQTMAYRFTVNFFISTGNNSKTMAQNVE